MGDYNDALMRNQNAAVQARTKAQSRANVLQLKMIGQSHPTGLTPNLLKLFEPRAPLEYKPPPEKRKCPPYCGIAQFVSHFAEPGDPEYAPPVQKAETPAQRRARVHQLRLDKGAAKAAEELEKYDPQNDPNASGDPYKTLFVARLSYETSESRLKREFETYGPIKRVKMIYDKETNKPKGYAFIEYAHTRDMKTAYKQGDGRKIDGRRVLVDVERGRTVPNWRPRRLGGGLGTSRVAVEEVNNRELQTGSVSASRSAEPRIRDDREKEKSRERGRDKEREQEKSRERSHDRPREREDRYHRESRDREKTKDRERERDRGRDHRDRDHGRSRDHDRGRDRGRDYERDRDRDRGDRRRERDKDRDYEMMDKDHDRGRSYDRGCDYVHVEGKHDKDRHGSKERGYDDRGWYDGQSDREHKHSEAEHDHYPLELYDHHDARGDQDRYNHYPDDRAQYEEMEDDYK